VTYLTIVLPFLAATVVVVLVSARRPGFGRRMAASAAAALILVALTAIFDNIMIASDLMTYPPDHLSGVHIGLAPIEDFSYAICAAFLVPAVYALLPGGSRREAA
jgi:lycopene cyclase domain-containing protein